MAGSSSDGPHPDRGRGEADDRVTKRDTYENTAPEKAASNQGPDVYLNVPVVKVDEIALEVENLDAHVSLAAGVLDLLKLNVGADVFLGKVNLEIKGVEAQALLEVRLDNVAIILDRVLTTLDRNPEILQHIGRGVESAARGVGEGAGEAVGELGKGAGGAVEEVGSGAREAVGELGKGAGGAVQDVGSGAREAVGELGKGAGGAVQDVGSGAREAAGELGKGAGGAVQDVGSGAREAAGELGKEAGGAVRGVAEGTGETAGAAGKTVGGAVGNTVGNTGGNSGGNTGGEAGESARQRGNGDRADGRESDAGLQGALREAQESIDGLSRALRRMSGASHRGDE
jgi:hypothetical protein